MSVGELARSRSFSSQAARRVSDSSRAFRFRARVRSRPDVSRCLGVAQRRAIESWSAQPPQSFSSTQNRRRVEQNRLLFKRDLGPDGATSLQGWIARQNNNDAWFRRAVDACSGEGLQTINGPATA
jgi:hypothetical protein